MRRRLARPVLAGALLTGGHGYARLYALFAVATSLGLAAFVIIGRRLAQSPQSRR